MNKNIIEDSILSGLADKIREKLGVTDKMLPGEMGGKIGEVQGCEGACVWKKCKPTYKIQIAEDYTDLYISQRSSSITTSKLTAGYFNQTFYSDCIFDSETKEIQLTGSTTTWSNPEKSSTYTGTTDEILDNYYFKKGDVIYCTDDTTYPYCERGGRSGTYYYYFYINNCREVKINYDLQFIEFVVSNDPLAYPTKDVHADGYYYEKIARASISFIVDNVTYKAMYGMSWAEWVESEYNTVGAYISQRGNIYFGEYVSGTVLYISCDGTNYEAGTAIIQDGMTYSYL